MKSTHYICGSAVLACLLSACVQQHTTVFMPQEPAPAPVVSKPATPKKMPVQPAAPKAPAAPAALPPLRGTHSQVISPGDGVKAKRSLGGEKVYAH